MIILCKKTDGPPTTWLPSPGRCGQLKSSEVFALPRFRRHRWPGLSSSLLSVLRGDRIMRFRFRDGGGFDGRSSDVRCALVLVVDDDVLFRSDASSTQNESCRPRITNIDYRDYHTIPIILSLKEGFRYTRTRVCVHKNPLL